MKFICLGYIAPDKLTSASESEMNAMMDSCFTYDDQLRSHGHFLGGEGLQPPNTAKTLRYEDGSLVITDGPFTETKEHLGGIMILEARDMTHAVELIAQHPGAKFGPWEIRAAADLSEMVRQSEARRRSAAAAKTFQSTRELSASPASVFAAINDPTRLAKWWGPDGFTNTFESIEFKPGGRWVFTMIGPDGKSYRNESTFGAIEPDRRVVIQHTSTPEFVLTISLQPTPKGTLVTWEQVFADPATAQAVRPIVEPSNEQNLDRLMREVQSSS